jgi:hypothetical protein
MFIWMYSYLDPQELEVCCFGLYSEIAKLAEHIERYYDIVVLVCVTTLSKRTYFSVSAIKNNN